MTAGNIPRACTEIRACARARIRETAFNDLRGRTHIRTDGRTGETKDQKRAEIVRS